MFERPHQLRPSEKDKKKHKKCSEQLFPGRKQSGLLPRRGSEQRGRDGALSVGTRFSLFSLEYFEMRSVEASFSFEVYQCAVKKFRNEYMVDYAYP